MAEGWRRLSSLRQPADMRRINRPVSGILRRNGASRGEFRMKVALVLAIPALLLSAFAWGVPQAKSPATRVQETTAMSNALFVVIEELMQARPFKPEAVGRITGTALRAPSPSSNQYFTMYDSARSSKAPLQAVELRVPTPAASVRDGLVILSIRTEAGIDPSTVMKRFGDSPEVSVPEPGAPYEFTYSYQHSWGKLSFQFARGRRLLKSAVVDATEPGPAASIGSATMSADGTITLDLRAVGSGGLTGDARFVYPRGHKDYEEILRHLGGLRPGETKPVPPWPEKKE